MKTSIAILGMALLFAFTSVSASGAPWYVEYDYAVKAIKRGDHQLAEQTLRDLTQQHAIPRENVRTYSVWRVDYTPYYYLGVALSEQGKTREGIKAFEFEMKFGVVQHDAAKMAEIERYQSMVAQADIRPAG